MEAKTKPPSKAVTKASKDLRMKGISDAALALEKIGENTRLKAKLAALKEQSDKPTLKKKVTKNSKKGR